MWRQAETEAEAAAEAEVVAEPCYWNIDEAIVTTHVDRIHQMYRHCCHRCGAELFRTTRWERIGLGEDALFSKAREKMLIHLGYAPADHFEAMGL